MISEVLRWLFLFPILGAAFWIGNITQGFHQGPGGVGGISKDEGYLPLSLSEQHPDQSIVQTGGGVPYQANNPLLGGIRTCNKLSQEFNSTIPVSGTLGSGIQYSGLSGLSVSGPSRPIFEGIGSGGESSSDGCHGVSLPVRNDGLLSSGQLAPVLFKKASGSAEASFKSDRRIHHLIPVHLSLRRELRWWLSQDRLSVGVSLKEESPLIVTTDTTEVCWVEGLTWRAT